jgi:hypothetical protein
MSVLLNMCSVHTMGMPSDFETVLEALRVLTNCVGAGALAMAERAAATTPAQRSSSRHSIVSVNAAGCDRGGAGAGVGTSGAGTGNATHDATEAALRTARESIRKANGMRTLLRLLFKGGVRPQAHLDAVTDGIRAMVCRVLLGLAQNPHILHTLQALQVRHPFLRAPIAPTAAACETAEQYPPPLAGHSGGGLGGGCVRIRWVGGCRSCCASRGSSGARAWRAWAATGMRRRRSSTRPPWSSSCCAPAAHCRQWRRPRTPLPPPSPRCVSDMLSASHSPVARLGSSNPLANLRPSTESCCRAHLSGRCKPARPFSSVGRTGRIIVLNCI